MRYLLHISGYAYAPPGSCVSHRVKRRALQEVRRIVGKRSEITWEERTVHLNCGSDWAKDPTRRWFQASAPTANRPMSVPTPVPRCWMRRDIHYRCPNTYEAHQAPWTPAISVDCQWPYIFGTVVTPDRQAFYMKVPMFSYVWERDL